MCLLSDITLREKHDCDGRWLSVDVSVCLGVPAPELDVSFQPRSDLLWSNIWVQPIVVDFRVRPFGFDLLFLAL